MHLDFLTPDVWNGLVIGTILIGLAFAALRLLRDWTVYQDARRRSRSPDGDRRPDNHDES
ncbi:MAG: hypothetical protein KJ047_14985 [Anaerolineae bacterium]|nr:hypothetical protein [Anaerolineae bacterium]MEB2286637.1 hypothetical protein [Anaerolineae bacterium]